MIIAALGDTHAPYQDDKAVDLACQILEAVKPDEVVHLSDGVDFYALSSFDRDPDRVLQLQDELDTGYEVHKRLASAAPDAEWYYCGGGNHERRLYRYLTKHPEMYGLRALRLDKLLRLDDLGWSTGEDGKEFLGRRLQLTHGEHYSKNAGWGVKRELEDRAYQQSVVMGHTHKIGKTTRRGPRLCVGGWEIGCLCTLEPEYRRNANWQQGMAIITTTDILGLHHFAVEPLEFVGRGKGARRVIFRGNEFVAK